MIDVQRSHTLENILPKVIRPDLILTDNGLSLTELDSVPGGMGITTWLSQIYSKAGYQILGGVNGITDGFSGLLTEGGHILISEESADYRPEMEFLASQLNIDISVNSVEKIINTNELTTSAYRFFEWFDWQNIPAAKALASLSTLTSPCKPHLEEKLWLALLWCPGLKPIWEQTLRASHLQRVKDIVPFSWVVDPSPLPPHASYPKLDVQTWDQVAQFSQSERELALKISGFHETAWGARGVHIGHDLPSKDWSAAIKQATDQFKTSPWVMQQFAHARTVEHPYFDRESGETKIMKGKVRLCPYYFTDSSGNTAFGGALATIVPLDKKKIHGMKDGILVPCMVEER